MRGLTWLVILVALIGLVAAFTKPSEARVEAELKDRFLDRLAKTNPSATENGGAFALTLMCKADGEACYSILRRGLEVRYRDRKLYALVDIAGFGKSVRCYGAFTGIYCAGDLPLANR